MAARSQFKLLFQPKERSIWHQNFEIRKEDTVLLKARKKSRNNHTKDMTLNVNSSVAKDELPAMLAIFLLYPPQNNAPAIAAVKKQATVPPIRALMPNSVRVLRWLGAIAPIPPIWMPMEAKFAKPQRA